PATNPRPMLHVAKELARRGFTAVAVMRPGYGSSEGKELPAECGNYVAQAEFAAQTLRETIRVMGQKAYVDPSRAIAIGHSTGGLGAVAATIRPPANLAAAISFAGNNGSQYFRGKLDPVCNAAELVETFATFGRRSHIPMLWIYGENDHHMGLALAKSYHRALPAGGRRAVFELAPAIGQDDHLLYAMPEAVDVWTHYVDKFLADQGLAPVSQPLAIATPEAA